MSKYNYEKVYYTPTEYNIIQLRGKRERLVTEDHHDYLAFLEEGNSPEIIPYILPTLQQVKDSKRSEIENSYQNALNEGCEVSFGFKMKTSENDRRFQSEGLSGVNTLVLKEIESNITVKDFDNVLHELTPSEYQTLGIELLNFYQTQWGKKNTYLSQIESATTMQEVEAIEWT